MFNLRVLLGRHKQKFNSLLPCPDRLWGPPSLLCNGYRSLFPWM